MSSINLDDDLIIFTTDPLDDLEYHSCTTSDLSTSVSSPSIQSNDKKMSDITDLLDSTDFHNSSELLSTDVMDYLCTHNLQNDQNNYEKSQWESEEKCLKYGSKQLSPNDYLTRTSLYNRPVAFEKDSRSWARSLLDNFKKSNQNFQSNSLSTSFPSYFPIIKKSSSFDHHVQYIEHLNECNDYPAYLEYLRENRSQLLCTLTDSIDVIDGLLGTVVSSF
ncbi:hypothetical protein I4U23_029064 [Adineta vaga]|nr:hypothetical protein I4U23_029064 [Adineta vaga]